MTQQLSCDAISIPEWKLELMAKKIFEKVWGNQNKAILRACKMIESCQNGKAATRMSAAPIQGQIEKIKKTQAELRCHACRRRTATGRISSPLQTGR